MLKKRLIPKLLIRHRQLGPVTRPVLVTTVGYREMREVGDPVSQAKIYEAQYADELIVLNIDGTPIAGDEMMLALIERLASETFMPLAVGGGVRSSDDFALLLARGADKVTINGEAVARPELIGEAASRFGAQCVVVSIDYRVDASGRAEVFVDHAARPTGLDVLTFAQRVGSAVRVPPAVLGVDDRRIREGDLHVARDDIGEAGRCALIGNVIQLDRCS